MYVAKEVVCLLLEKGLCLKSIANILSLHLRPGAKRLCPDVLRIEVVGYPQKEKQTATFLGV